MSRIGVDRVFALQNTFLLPTTTEITPQNCKIDFVDTFKAMIGLRHLASLPTVLVLIHPVSLTTPRKTASQLQPMILTRRPRLTLRILQYQTTLNPTRLLVRVLPTLGPRFALVLVLLSSTPEDNNRHHPALRSTRHLNHPITPPVTEHLPHTPTLDPHHLVVLSLHDQKVSSQPQIYTLYLELPEMLQRLKLGKHIAI
jgi:hypothetical protein